MHYFHGTIVLHEDQITRYGSQFCIAYGRSLENTNNEDIRIARTQFRGQGNWFTTGFTTVFSYLSTNHPNGTETMRTGDQLAGYSRFMSIFPTAAINYFRFRGIFLIEGDVTRQAEIYSSFTATPLELLLDNFSNVGIDLQLGIHEEFTTIITPGTVCGVQTVFSNDEILQNLERTFVFSNLALGYAPNTANLFHEEQFIDTLGFTYMYTFIAVHPVAVPETIFTEEESTRHPESTFVLTGSPLDNNATAANEDQFAAYVAIPTDVLTIGIRCYVCSYISDIFRVNYEEHSAGYQQNTVPVEIFYYY